MSSRNKKQPETDTIGATDLSDGESASTADVLNEPETADQATDHDTAEENAPENDTAQEETPDSLRQELQTANDRYIRLMAEFDNYKKRTGREHERRVELANEKLMLELIDVRETFERALKHSENADLQSFVDGIKLIFNKFDGVLSTNGLAPFAQSGEEFDPQVHDALMKTPHPEIPEDHITEIFEKGYLLKDRVIKHARVIVSAGPPAEDNETSK